jgi:two-component sensor histidine kinase/HAMP domain-containing protein
MRKGRATPGERGAGFSLRLRIFSSFLLLAAITAGLGAFAARGVGRSGATVAAIFDQALMATSYTRAAAANFAAMEAAFVRRRLAPGPDARRAEGDRFDGLAELVAGDLRIVADRATSGSVSRAVSDAHAAALAWIGAARAAHHRDSPDWAGLAALAAAAEEKFEVLVNLVAGDAFRQRQQARAAVAAARWWTVAGTAAALLLGAAVAAMLVRRIVGPVAAASRTASGIASGRLDTPIPAGGQDELGTLLDAMGRMRDSIRATIEREKAERCDAQARFADAMEGSTEGIVLTDASGRIAAANRRAAELLPGVALEVGADWGRAAAALDAPDAEAAAALRHAPPAAAEIMVPGGRWLRVSRSPARGGGAVAILSDVTGRKAHEAALSESNRRFAAALGNMAQGLCMVDAEARVLVCNRRFCEMFGLPPAETVAGMTVRDASRIAFESARYPVDLLAGIMEDQRSLAAGSAPLSAVREGAGGAALAISYVPMPGGGWVATYSDVSERRAAEERQTLLMRELDHRAKNALAVVQAALRLTPKHDAEAYARAVGGRVNALARAHALLAKGQWSGAELRDLAWGELAPFLGGAPPADGQPQPRAALDGPEVTLVPGAAQAISMALHELATNATKHGALSTPEGRVSMFWEADADAGLLRLLWTEAGGPPIPAPPARRGFGSRVLEATLRDQLGGRLTREWRPGGLVCAIELPLARALAGQALLRPIRTGLESNFVPTGGGMVAPQHGARAAAAGDAARPPKGREAAPAVAEPGGGTAALAARAPAAGPGREA